MSHLWQIIVVFQWNRSSMLTKRFGSSYPTRLGASCNRKQVRQRLSTPPLQSCVNIPRCCNTWHLCRASRAIDLNSRPVPFRAPKARGLSRQMEKANIEKEKARHRVQAFRCLTIVRFLLMENSCASAGRLDVAQPK